MNIIAWILAILLYIFIGCLLCNYYITQQNRQAIIDKHKPKENMVQRVLFRLSVVLFYPLYIIGVLSLYLVELLTEDEPFK